MEESSFQNQAVDAYAGADEAGIARGDRRLWRAGEELLAAADVRLNGGRAWDIQVRDERFLARMFADGSLGVGESYMDGWWECDRLDELAFRTFRARLESKLPLTWRSVLSRLQARLANMQSRARSRHVVREHYDLGNDLYEAFLDPYNQYTCAYFKDTTDLNQAQEHKLDLICRKLRLTPADRVLDVGCGWGGFAKFAASRYGCSVTGISISDEQIRYARELCAGLPVSIERRDYRDLAGAFDKVLVCGMIEHVGYKNHRLLMEKVHSVLQPDGIFLLHTIGENVSTTQTNPWMLKYIFPNAVIPSMKQLSTALEGLFVVEDWHNFGAQYDPTLMCWYQNLERNWPRLKGRYDERLFRMFKFYFLFCAGEFRARAANLWQIVMTKGGIVGGYPSIR